MADRLLLCGIISRGLAHFTARAAEAQKEQNKKRRRLKKEHVYEARKSCLKEVSGLIERTIKTTSIPGMVAAVSVNGSTVYKRAFGHQDCENKVRCTADMCINIGDLSQGFLCYFLALLYDAGKIKSPELDVVRHLSDTLRPVIVDSCDSKPTRTDEMGRKIPAHTYNLEHLLTHTSGLPDTASEVCLDEQRDCEGSIARSIEQFSDDPLLFKPGTKFNKSGLGCQVIGSVVERAAGQPYPQFANQQLIRMGLTSTHVTDSRDLTLNNSRGLDGGEATVNRDWVDPSWREASQGITSNAQDLIKFSHLMFMAGVNDVGNSGRKKKFIRDSLSFSNYRNRTATENLYGYLWHLNTKTTCQNGATRVAFYYSQLSAKPNTNSGVVLMRWEAQEGYDMPYMGTVDREEQRRSPFYEIVQRRGLLVSVVLLCTVDKHDCSQLAQAIADLVADGFREEKDSEKGK